MKYEDLTGRKFGRWTVLSCSDDRLNGSIGWNCVCKCGITRVVSQHSLCRTTKPSKSCGCLTKELSKESSKRRIKYTGNTHERLVYIGYQRNAKQKGFIFDLKEDAFYELIHANCSYCGNPPQNVRSDEYTDVTMLYTGIDRVDSSVGYVTDNVVPCCKTCNLMKLDMSQDEFLSWVSRVHAHLGL